MKPTKITIHCSATKNNSRVDIDTIRKWHIDRGWRDVGYHIVIQPSGEVQNGRPLNKIAAHVSGFNINNIGLCLIGDTKFTKEQFEALRYQLEGLWHLYGIPPYRVFGHYEFTDQKTCPNIRIGNLVHWINTGDYRALSDYLIDP